jgi:tRNA pseudouridine38-40 synthase
MILFENAPEPAAPLEPLVRVRMLVAYDGTGFHGFPAQRGVATVGETLGEAMARVLRRPVELVCAGRTDAGVHAWGQVVSTDLAAETDLVVLRRRLNSLVAPAIVVRSIEPAPDGFDARHTALWRRYRYTILQRDVPDPFSATTAWHVGQVLDLSALRLAADPFIGEHDFSSFCRRPKPSPGFPAHSLVRRVLDTSWTDLGDDHLRFEIRATSFCQQMVRSIVGLLVDVGRGRRHPGDVLAILRARDRAAAGTLAPPHGLCLWEVGYPPDEEVARPAATIGDL